MPGRFPTIRAALTVLLVCTVGMACSSSQRTTERAASHAAAIGTWKYEVSGRAPINQGTFTITLKKGRLYAVIRDKYRGPLAAEVHVRSSRMELTIGSLHVSGHIEDDRFSGFLRPEQYDVSIDDPDAQPSRRREVAYLRAERVRSASVIDDPRVLDCESLLREESGCS